MNQTLQAIAPKYNLSPCRTPELIPSGLPALDAVTGGIPKGRIVDIHGAEDSGKTSLALALAKGATLYLDGESKLVSSHVRGVENFFVMRPKTLENALEVCRTAARGFDTIIVDTLESIPTGYDLSMGVSRHYEDSDRKVRETLLSHALPVLAPELIANGCTLILVNQMRDRQGVVYGKPDFSTGGKALPYYATLRLELNLVEYIKSRHEVMGQKVLVMVQKNKFCKPFGRAELLLDYRRGWQWLHKEGA